MQLEQESLLEFPCAFPIKAMGYYSADFSEQIWRIINRHAPDAKRADLSVRASRNSKYLAVSVTIQASSRAQLDAIYQELSAHEQVVMAL